MFLTCGRRRIHVFRGPLSLQETIHFMSLSSSPPPPWRKVNFWIFLKVYIRGIKWKEILCWGKRPKTFLPPIFQCAFSWGKVNMCSRFPFLILIPTSPLPERKRDGNKIILVSWNRLILLSFSKLNYLVNCQSLCSYSLNTVFKRNL